MLYVWIALIAVCTVLEVLTKRLIAVWGAPAALVALVISLIQGPLPLQLGLFAALTLIGILLGRFLFGKRDTVADLDHVIGCTAKVTETVGGDASCGQVCIEGQYWAARGIHDDDRFEVGATVRIVAIEGVKLICTGV